MERVAQQCADVDSMRGSGPPEACATVRSFTWKKFERRNANANSHTLSLSFSFGFLSLSLPGRWSDTRFVYEQNT